jgi:hypothetical protein
VAIIQICSCSNHASNSPRAQAEISGSHHADRIRDDRQARAEAVSRRDDRQLDALANTLLDALTGIRVAMRVDARVMKASGRIDKTAPLEIELQERAKEFVAQGGGVYERSVGTPLHADTLGTDTRKIRIR